MARGETPTLDLPKAWQPYAAATPEQSKTPEHVPGLPLDILSPAAPKSLVSKLAEVMAAVHRVPKHGRNDFHKYDYATEADIAATIRGELASRGVMLMPSIIGESREPVGENGDVLTILSMEMEFLDGETQESIKKPWRGYGSDRSDKGGYKAMTGAEKYFLLKTFLIPTGDDPEADDKTRQPKGKAEAPRELLPPMLEARAPRGVVSGLPPEGAVWLMEVKKGFDPALAVLVTDTGEELPMFKVPVVEIARQLCQDGQPAWLDIKHGKKTGKPYAAMVHRTPPPVF